MENATQPISPKIHTLRTVVYLIVTMIILLGVVIAFQIRGWNTSSQNAGGVITTTYLSPTPNPNIKMMLVGAGAGQYPMTSNITVTLTGSSDNKDIVGYDALVKYDPAFLDVVSVTSANPSFQISTFRKTNGLSITGTKSLSVKTSTVFQSSTLVTVVFKPKSRGNTMVSVVSNEGKESSKFIDTSSTILVPQVEPITLAIY